MAIDTKVSTQAPHVGHRSVAAALDSGHASTVPVLRDYVFYAGAWWVPASSGWVKVPGPGRAGGLADGLMMFLEAGILYAILFLWQFPHFYAIAWMYREDYARAGIRMLPVVEPETGTCLGLLRLHDIYRADPE